MPLIRFRRHLPPRSLAVVVVVLLASGCGGPARPASPAPAVEERTPGSPRHPVTVRTPAGPPTVAIDAVDAKGHPITLGCATCHTNKQPLPDARFGTRFVLFHKGLTGSHGSLACAACHNPADGYGTLRLADGKSVPYTDVMTLCAQCHGPQYRDYQHGAHGGMMGHWDLTTGGRVRNNCVDCHAPHAPKYPTVSPARGPNDRFQTGGGHE